MTPLLLFYYLLACAGGLAVCLFVLFCFACLWLFMVGSSTARGRGE